MSLKKLTLAGLVVALLSIPAVAEAGAVRVRLLPPSPTPPSRARGEAVLVYNQHHDKTLIQVVCVGLTAGTTYHVNLKGTSDAVVPLGDFVARRGGCGFLHVAKDHDLTGAANFPMTVTGSANPPVIVLTGSPPPPRPPHPPHPPTPPTPPSP